MIFVLVYSTSGISGGHINPAVTFGLLVARKVSVVRAVAYMVAQCLGGICGVGLVKGVMKHDYNTHGGGANTVAVGYSTAAALGAEIIGTFILMYTVFSATDAKNKARDSHVPVLAPLPIGFSVFMVHLATIPILALASILLGVLELLSFTTIPLLEMTIGSSGLDPFWEHWLLLSITSKFCEVTLPKLFNSSYSN